MPTLAKNILPMVEENAASPEIARIYGEIKRELQMPFVPNMIKSLAVSPGALTMYWGMISSFYRHSSLPQALTSMILYTIAETSNCTYCSAGNELNCRTLGIDEATLQALVKDLANVSPERVRAIIGFCLKVAHDPQGMVAEDYQSLLEQGISQAEMAELMLVASVANMVDTLADALKIEVDPQVSQALGR